MTAAQRSAMYGDSPNAPSKTSNVSQVQAEAKQKALEKGESCIKKPLNSDTVAIDFAHPTTATAPAAGSPVKLNPPPYWANVRRCHLGQTSETMAASTSRGGRSQPSPPGCTMRASDQQPKAGR